MIELVEQPSAEALVRDAAGRLIRIPEALEDGDSELAFVITEALETDFVGWAEREAA
jgi:hypothetical protein